MELMKIILLCSVFLVGCEISPKVPLGEFTSTNYFQSCENNASKTFNCVFLDKNSRKFITSKLVIAKFTRLTYSKNLNQLINWSGLAMINCDKSEISYKYATTPTGLWSDWKYEPELGSLKKLMNEACIYGN